MSANFRVVTADDPMEKQSKPIDWNLCLLCQRNTRENLSNPKNNSRPDKYEGYKSLETILTALDELRQLNSLPFSVNISSLNNGTGLLKTFVKNEAKYHSSCKRCVSERRLQRAQKRAQKELKKDSPIKTRRLSVPFECLFCDCPATRKHTLCKVSNPETSSKIIKFAQIFRNRKLMAKIAGAHDLMALKAVYHERCLADYNNKIRSHERQHGAESSSLRECYSYALAMVVAFINDVQSQEPKGDVPVFKITDLAQVYASTLKNMGVEHTVHTSRLRDRLLNECPYLTALDGSPGQEIHLTFRSDVDDAIRSACRDYEAAAFQFCDTAKVIRKDIFEFENSRWEDYMSKQGESTPLSLKTLLMMILRGPGSVASSDEEHDEFDQVVKTISQLICFHTTKRSSGSSTTRRHTREREKPVPVYFAMKLYGETRSKNLIQTAHRLGLTISYDRLQTILNDTASASCSRFRQLNVVCPQSLQEGVFTVAAADNIDHDTSSFTAKTSFHGTAITLTQLPDPTSPGKVQDVVSCDLQTSFELPETYALVKPCFLNESRLRVPTSIHSSLELTLTSEDDGERKWLNECRTREVLPWAVYHARLSDPVACTISNSAVLPLFPDHAQSIAMMVHAMNVVSSAIHHINPDQTPVVVVDQPLFALCKTAQFLKPATHGEDKFMIMMGGLHIEMAALRGLGTFLENSGWTNALVTAGVTTQGRSESMLKASHVTRTRYAHQVTAVVLHDLQQAAYESYVDTHVANDSFPPPTFEEWHVEKSTTVPQFKYWDLVLKLETLLLFFVRSVRQGNFANYKLALSRLVGWFFAFNQVNYARWLPIHIRDLVTLNERHPHIAEKFEAGFFVARKTSRILSAVAFDQNHEQVNAMLKGNGGMVGLTENPEALRKWVLVTPELATLVTEFEEANLIQTDDVTTHHHDKQYFIQRFQQDCSSLKSVLETLGNPFTEEGGDLYNIDSKVLAGEQAADILQRIENEGSQQYRNFVQERLQTSVKSISDTIPQNHFSLWTARKSRCKSKEAAQLKVLRNDCALFSRLFIACQSREGDLDEFFRHENQPYPPSIAVMNQIRSCVKSDVIGCLTSVCEGAVLSSDASPPAVDAKFFDGAALVHMLPVGHAVTFQDYIDQVFLPFIRNQCTSGVKRIDIVWDTYNNTSLKNALREKRGTGSRLLVTPETKLPRKSWMTFLRESENKTQLFGLLAKSVNRFRVDGVDFYSTHKTSVIAYPDDADVSAMSPCNHEEADTRLLLHVADAARKGLSKALIRTADSDVLVLSVAYSLKIEGLHELWVSIGMGKNHRLIAAHAIAASLGPERSAALPLFHAFSGRDVSSSFSGKGKKSNFETWTACQDATKGFLLIGDGNLENGLPLMEKFVVALYDRTSDVAGVNDCRRKLFTRKGKPLEAIPPSQDALRQHCLRSGYQGGQVWGQCLKAEQDLPDPSLWGWSHSQQNVAYWEPVWTTLPAVQQSLLTLVKCGCKKPCSISRCKCLKANLPCTELCYCAGECQICD